ncbi:uncharacterized protein LOC143021532 [Oratosquilla oratoria]|uniref:uncharacterized protein LOC143021532 n=1 Tax=Oratosquilla oratoria TaxID=337810 RepID=UPI003F766D72
MVEVSEAREDLAEGRDGGQGREGHGGGTGSGGDSYGYRARGYKPQCYPQTITKFKTVYKDRKAEVVNDVEVRNPQPQIKTVKETRYTTVRYPVFITQVLKPRLTQVETKVRPMFFTKTIKRHRTIFFTVTGIGQVTVTTVKFEKEYITRCNNKGYGHHRREGTAGPEVEVESVEPVLPTYRTSTYSPEPSPYGFDDAPAEREEVEEEGRKDSSSSSARYRRPRPPQVPALPPVAHGGFGAPPFGPLGPPDPGFKPGPPYAIGALEASRPSVDGPLPGSHPPLSRYPPNPLLG